MVNLLEVLHGDALTMLRTLKSESVQCVNAGRFKKGQHWRPRRRHWDREYLIAEYVTNARSASDIAKDNECTENNILHWLTKHEIPRRTISSARAVKYWGAAGEANPMYGVKGQRNPNWKGGATPERQAFYSSREWAAACSEVWKRDEACCQRCGTDWRQAKLNVHHIAPFSVIELRATDSNLVLLCVDCHQFVHSRKNESREYIAAAGKEGE